MSSGQRAQGLLALPWKSGMQMQSNCLALPTAGLLSVPEYPALQTQSVMAVLPVVSVAAFTGQVLALDQVHHSPTISGRG